MAKANVLLAPNTRVLVKLPVKARREINWYAEQGMPAQGTVLHAIKRVVDARREMK